MKYNKMSEQDRKEVVASLSSLAVNGFFMYKAVRAFRRGDMAKAQFFITVWVGTCMNGNANLAMLRQQKNVSSLGQTLTGIR